MNLKLETKDLNEGIVKLNLQNRDFPVPDFVTSLDIKFNKYHSTHKHKIEECLDWFGLFSQLPKDKYKGIRETAATFCTSVWPYCQELDRFENLINIQAALFVLDDHWETEWGNVFYDADRCQVYQEQFSKLFNRLISEEYISLATIEPFLLAFYIVLDTICAKYNEVQKRRLIHCFKVYIKGLALESETICNNIKFDSIEEYINVRIKSIGVLPCAQLIEYSDNIFLPEEDWNDPKLIRLTDLVSLNVIYVNDLYSYEKEIKQGKGSSDKMFNIVALICRLDKCNAWDAMNKLLVLIKQNEQELDDLLKEITTDECCCNEKRIYANRVLYIASGNYKTSLIIKRYNNFD